MKRTIVIDSFIQDASGHTEINYRILPSESTGVLVFDSKEQFLQACIDPIGGQLELGARIAIAAYLGVDPQAEQPELLTGVQTEVDFEDLTIVRRVLV
jgi:hypothetical protein